jgi:hypothetical protein
MEKVNVNKEELLAILKNNRDIHQKNYDDAMGGYRMLAEKELKKKLKAVKEGEKFDLYFRDLSEPRSYVKDYNNTIGILEVSNDGNVSITMEEYLKYYKNEWEWSRMWKNDFLPYATLYNVAGVGAVKSNK